ncbi:hypothetical protein GCM10010304_51980 [Streptomyces roseoviolaceus]
MHTSLTGPPPTGAATGPARATAEELDHQKAAITRLGHELRALVEATVRTAASPDTLHRVADGVRHVTGQLTGKIFVSGSITTVTEVVGRTDPAHMRPGNPANALLPLRPPPDSPDRVLRQRGGEMGTASWYVMSG